MPILGIVGLAIQVFFAVHAVKNGKDRYWIYIIVFLPGIGSLIYFLTEYLPDLQSDLKKQGVKKKRMKIGYLKDQVELVPSVKNRKLLAEAYLNKGYFDKALALYNDCLEGIHENDPAILEGICLAHLLKGDLKKARDNLIGLKNTREQDLVGDEFDLLLARIYEELGETDRALKEYSGLVDLFSGEEARCRYALLLKKTGEISKADRYFKEILKNARLSPGFYRNAQKKWIQIAKREAQ